MRTGDANGDGALHLIVTDWNVTTGNRVAVLSRKCGGTLEYTDDFATRLAPHAVLVQDFNGNV